MRPQSTLGSGGISTLNTWFSVLARVGFPMGRSPRVPDTTL
jgi:hypothetical protein